jgi:type I restriction enzyme S subunit
MTLSGELVLDSCPSISWKKYYESPEIMLKAGMLLFVQRGSTVGKVAYVPDGLGPATINPSLIVLRDIRMRPIFLTYCLMSSSIQTLVKIQTSTTAIPMISQEQVGNYWQCIPPIEEQVQIENYIQDQLTKLDSAINTAQKSIELSMERRTALISAAVTGKIDVRDWQAPSDVAIAA